MEKLNVKEIKNIRTSIMSSDKNISYKGDSRIKILKAFVTSNGEDINYSFEDIKDNIRVSISGNDFNGYTKKENKLNDPTYEKKSVFFPNGNLKSTGVMYINVKGEEPDGLTRAIGKWYRYNEKEEVIEIIEYDESDFLFTIDDVNAFVKKEGMKITTIILRPKTTINNVKVHDAAWLISFSEKPGTITQMTLDAKTGEIIYKGDPQRIIK